MGFGVEVFNEQGTKIIGSDVRLSGIKDTFSIKDVSEVYNLTTLKAPSFIDKGVGVVSSSVDVADYTTTFFKWNDGACVCGRSWYSANAGSLIYCNLDFTPESGYQDIYDSNGKLIWSAKSAGKMPMIKKVIELGYSALTDGVTIDLGGNSLLMNNLPTILLPAARGNSAVGGMYMKFSGTTAQIKFSISETMNIATTLQSQLNGQPFRLFVSDVY